jgi:short-subunit dehydrogenase
VRRFIGCGSNRKWLLKSILNDFRTIDVVINNAGVGYRSFVELAEDDEINKIVEVNGSVW